MMLVNEYVHLNDLVVCRSGWWTWLCVTIAWYGKDQQLQWFWVSTGWGRVRWSIGERYSRSAGAARLWLCRTADLS